MPPPPSCSCVLRLDICPICSLCRCLPPVLLPFWGGISLKNVNRIRSSLLQPCGDFLSLWSPAACSSLTSHHLPLSSRHADPSRTTLRHIKHVSAVVSFLYQECSPFPSAPMCAGSLVPLRLTSHAISSDRPSLRTRSHIVPAYSHAACVFFIAFVTVGNRLSVSPPHTTNSLRAGTLSVLSCAPAAGIR